MLKWSRNNRKLRQLAINQGIQINQVVGFDIPAGHTCPNANICQGWANKKTGKMTHGKNMVFQCYAIRLECAFPSVRAAHWINYDSLRGLPVDAMVELINCNIPKGVKIIRVHASGDFYSWEYFLAWVEVARLNPNIIFFGYSKVLDCVTAIKSGNFKLVYSYGGLDDERAASVKVPTAYVILDPINAVYQIACKNPLDTRDYECIINQESFSLLLHTGGRKHGWNI